ncbi:lpxH [Acrasis kona]|uniref:LpxH n=1 Tax=Acrasis kona TaxID=1008807 RepID=A0AAW2Z7Q9_9EUKA
MIKAGLVLVLIVLISTVCAGPCPIGSYDQIGYRPCAVCPFGFHCPDGKSCPREEHVIVYIKTSCLPSTTHPDTVNLISEQYTVENMYTGFAVMETSYLFLEHERNVVLNVVQQDNVDLTVYGSLTNPRPNEQNHTFKAVGSRITELLLAKEQSLGRVFVSVSAPA